MCQSSFVILVFFHLFLRPSPTSEVERVVFFAHFVEMSQQAAAATFLASRQQVPNVSTDKEKRTNWQRHSARLPPNIMTKIQNTLTKPTRLNIEFIAQEVGLLHQRVELLICQKDSIIDVPCCD